MNPSIRLPGFSYRVPLTECFTLLGMVIFDTTCSLKTSQQLQEKKKRKQFHGFQERLAVPHLLKENVLVSNRFSQGNFNISVLGIYVRTNSLVSCDFSVLNVCSMPGTVIGAKKMKT